MSTAIEWTDETWNPIVGCERVSPGCAHCYAERMARRQTFMRPGCEYCEVIEENGRWNGRTVEVPSAWDKPLRWRTPRQVFVCSMGDVFHESVPFAWVDRVLGIAARTPQHTYQILTKRPERIARCLPHDWGDGWPNVWLGVSIELQEYLYRKRILASLPARLRFISAEPLLGPIHLGALELIGWVITGGESGPEARPMNPDWVRSLRDQCVEAGLPFFHKQNGGNQKVAGAWGGRILDGVTWDQMPGSCTVRG